MHITIKELERKHKIVKRNYHSTKNTGMKKDYSDMEDQIKVQSLWN